jgi:hypothetical protein
MWLTVASVDYTPPFHVVFSKLVIYIQTAQYMKRRCEAVVVVAVSRLFVMGCLISVPAMQFPLGWRKL